MFNMGDDIILDSFNIPWLIWIQLIVLFLLILLLSYFGLVSPDLPPAELSPPSAISSAGVAQVALSCSQGHNPEAQEQRVQDRQIHNEGNTTSIKDLQHLFHPCYYFELAKQAFLQCLGLGSAPRNSRERGHDE